MNKQFIDKVALVTGASSGIGRATALAFAAKGAKVVLSDVAARGGIETAKEIKQNGGDSIFVKADVSIADEVEMLIDTTVSSYGNLNYAHNNAGIGGSHLLTHEYMEDEWDRIIDINLKSVWLCQKYEIIQMIKQGYGAIVNTASVAGLIADGAGCGYIASKHGVIGLTKKAALEYAKLGIRVNAVCPGVINTPMMDEVFSSNPDTQLQEIESVHPIGRLGIPEEIANAVVWLCSPDASFVTGHSMIVDGGYTAQ